MVRGKVLKSVGDVFVANRRNFCINFRDKKSETCDNLHSPCRGHEKELALVEIGMAFCIISH